ncbi:MAG: hypothetical protein COX81_01965 [Candidatus Magasanikbacteria bacterium CG_4_10_14_0_2_um_filter_37_12]|uniref:Gcp-like domain-containing protein n=1 Tax=Candidatus Magasanikbacteria bacterium CG_4_10_14_0_2_um_filter_37_12 TaxID=1974637 RepID=A0A2M7V8C3_9BACT|nr:MAG: hypothetical protein COX81_01965 [Candidatus Magasanikbacteria bacterium CG_4_10_14_0_2_um_filter_37_12]
MSEKDQIHLALFDEEKMVDKIYEGRNKELLFLIEDFLVSMGLNKESVHGIIVVVGAGSFTSTRIACVVANTFAYVKQIPLLAISVGDVDMVQELIPKLLEQPKGQYISAEYSGEPNIGVIQR